MSDYSNFSKKGCPVALVTRDYRLEPYQKHLIINKIQTQTQISSNGIASSSKTANSNSGNNILTTIQTSIIDFDQVNTSLIGHCDTNHLKQCSKDYFTPRQIYLWVKLLELIVHLSKDLNEMLNNDYISMEWIIHREKIRKGLITKITDNEKILIQSYISEIHSASFKEISFSWELIQAISAIIFRHPKQVHLLWDEIKKKIVMDLDPEKKNNNIKMMVNKPIFNSMMSMKNKLKGLNSSKEVDKRFEELWNPYLQSPRSKCPYDIMNIMDDDKIPQLEFIKDNIIHPNVKGPNLLENFACACADNCQKTAVCQCMLIDEETHGEGFPFKKDRLSRSDIGAIYECNSRCNCDMSCPNRIFKTKEKGWGVRTFHFIKEGEFVMEHVGEVIDAKIASLRAVCYDKLDTMSYFDLDYDFDKKERRQVLSLDSNYWCGISRFLNHSCNANLITIPNKDKRWQRIAFFAQRDIKASSELTLDYKIETEDFVCYCGSQYCR
ncbi:7091_t:CDS:10 [Funneliformis mosseae]|uniref:7091_t:CDS:1 n=1 Tax=Funneliformis mosseae TaxID=27381 RepID=A0A9N9GA70_FUNMO|nr:7091_t:CDS:10 [Funneliformis mosseae]